MKLKLILGAILSGVLLSAAWLGVSGLILLVAFVPLLYVEDYYLRHKAEYVSMIFWSYSLLTFLIWNVLTTWWIGYATIIGAAFAIVVNTFLMSLVWWAIHECRRLRSNGFTNFFLVFIWLSFEYLHLNWELSWPWLNLGNGFANNIHLIQWYEYTGVLGGSLWVLITNLTIWSFLKKIFIQKQPFRLSNLVSVLTIFIIPVLISLIIFRAYHEKEDPVSVVVGQPNIDPYNEKFGGLTYNQQYDSLFSVVKTAGDSTVDFIVGPETALHEVWLNNIERNSAVRRVERFMDDNFPQAAFVVGAMMYKAYEKDEKTPSTARYNGDSTFVYDAFNSALLIDSGNVKDVYHKSKLVSGVEKMPYERYLAFMKRLVIDLGGTTGSLATMDEPVVFEWNGIKVGVPICYESGYGEYVSGFVKKGAELLFVITNDGWWKDSPGYKQHFSYSRIMAIQLRRSIARSGNTGISGFINQKGEVISKTQWWTKIGLKGNINRNDTLTFYAQNGDYIGRIAVFMFLLMGLSIVVIKLKK